MNNVLFSCTSLNGSNKTGALRVDEDGYYEMVVGALNMFNSAGSYYPFDRARNLFEDSGVLQRRIKRGALRGEYGHPKQQLGQSLDSFAQRVLTIDEANVCCHFKELYLDFDSIRDPNGNKVIAIIGKLIPSGPKADALERSLKNKNENVCFSIRAFTEDRVNMGVVERHLRQIVTFDYVNEPGMAVAERWKSPALEALGMVDVDGQPLTSITFGRGNLERAVAKTKELAGVAQESVMVTAGDLFHSMGWDVPTDALSRLGGTPGWSGWR